MRIISFNAVILAILLPCSMSVLSANTIHLNGKITEDTCSLRNTDVGCQSLNEIHKKIETLTSTIHDLDLKTEHHDLAVYQVDRIKTEHAVIIATYH